MPEEHLTRITERGGRTALLLAVSALLPAILSATSFLPISDRELRSRADVVVRGIVVATNVSEDPSGRPETVTMIEPLEVLKGELSGALVLHQLGGRLPDGRYFQLWGRPEYQPGHEVVVFAIRRPEGDFQTAEMVLGKFEVQEDEEGQLFAVPGLVADAPAQVTVVRRAKDVPGDSDDLAESSSPRHLDVFMRDLRQPGAPATRDPAAVTSPRGALRSAIHPEYVTGNLLPQWGNVSGLWRWTNGATALWSIDGQANITGGGVSEVTAATATWDGEPHSTINYSVGSAGTNPVHVDALTSPCGWTSCLAGGGVVGCGGPQGGLATTWRGETYLQITSGEVWVRSFCTLNLYPSAIYQAIVTHELGHTLGLGHSDQTVSPHDVCRGDEDAAQMRSVVQNYTTLGTDDSDAVRWLYGDGGNSCGMSGPTPPTVTTDSATGITQTGSTLTGTVNPNGTSTSAYFQYGTTTGYGFATPSQSVGSGSSAVALQQALSALLCGLTYHFRTVAVTSYATTYGPDQVFTTSACAPAGVYTLTPCRLIDTRNAAGPLGGPSLAAGTARSFTLAGQCGIPAGTRSISVNVTVVSPTTTGFLTLYPGGTSLPLASTLNYKGGKTRANSSILTLGTAGDAVVWCGQASGATDMVLDVNGYFK